MFGRRTKKIKILREQYAVENGKYGISAEMVNADYDAQNA